MPVLNEARHAGEFILSEANGHRSRDVITIASGQGKLPAGAVLGKITASGKYALVTVAATDGSQNAAAVLLDAVDATSADVKATGITRHAEVMAPMLTYGADVDTAPEIAAVATSLASVGIIVR